MNTTVVAMTAAAVGAAVTYVLDPDRGRRRRALVRDRVVSLAHASRAAADTTSRDVANRARGLFASLRSRAVQELPSDAVLAARVRARLGFAVRHPGSVEVDVTGGRVTISGPVLADEAGRLLDRVARMRGVAEVHNRLQVHDRFDGVPGLQGEPSSRWGAWEFEWMQRNWSPAARLVAGLTGGALLIAGLGRRGSLGIAVGILGAALLARALTNRELARLAGVRHRSA